MKKILNLLLFILLVCSISISNAQVIKTNIVEHFTNTSCSVCANNNDEIYEDIDLYPGTLHISFHPSSPYENDIFNLENMAENDGRTYFYNIYGSTPRIAVNGVTQSYTTLASTLSSIQTVTTNFDVRVYQTQVRSDSFDVKVSIKKQIDDPLTSALLFVGVVEDTVFQTTDNGEDIHLNVFRKSLTDIVGNTIDLPVVVGDSIQFIFGYKSGDSWDVNRLSALAILQQTDKPLINAATSINNIDIAAGINLNLLASNCDNVLEANIINNNIRFKTDVNYFVIFNQLGQKIIAGENIQSGAEFDLTFLKSGIYFMHYVTNDNTCGLKLYKL